MKDFKKHMMNEHPCLVEIIDDIYDKIDSSSGGSEPLIIGSHSTADIEILDLNNISLSVDNVNQIASCDVIILKMADVAQNLTTEAGEDVYFRRARAFPINGNWTLFYEGTGSRDKVAFIVIDTVAHTVSFRFKNPI